MMQERVNVRWQFKTEVYVIPSTQLKYNTGALHAGTEMGQIRISMIRMRQILCSVHETRVRLTRYLARAGVYVHHTCTLRALAIFNCESGFRVLDRCAVWIAPLTSHNYMQKKTSRSDVC